jgi:hypothetical protein
VASLSAAWAPLPHRSPPVERPIALGAPAPKRGLNGSPKRWHERDVAIQIDPAVEQALPGATRAVEQAFGAWQGSGADLPRFSFTVAASSETASELDGVNRVLYGPIEIPGYRNALAITLTYVDEETGEILEADLLLNSRNALGLLAGDAESKAAAAQAGNGVSRVPEDDHDQSTSEAPAPSGQEESPALVSCGGSARAAATCGDQYDLGSVLTHEAGHLLGLGDDPTEVAATMYYCTSPCETHKRQPRTSDNQALQESYAGGFEERPPANCAVARVRAPRSGAGSTLGLACALLAVGWLGRRRLVGRARPASE